MAFDEALLEKAARMGRPVLRLYGWAEEAATFGYSQRYAEVASWTKLRPLIRRPTGGGLVPHDADWTYSIVAPPGHEWYGLRAEESYRRAHDWVAASFQKMRVAAELAACCAKELPGRCFIGAEKFDVLADGRKIAGAAQKRNRMGLLIQGSIQPAKEWKRADWEAEFLRIGEERFGIKWGEPADDGVNARAEVLDQEKYAREQYNQKR
jgi:lipoate-protein ligase A